MKHIQFTRQGRGIVVAYPGFLFIALLKSATDGKPVVSIYRARSFARSPYNRVYRPFGGK